MAATDRQAPHDGRGIARVRSRTTLRFLLRRFLSDTRALETVEWAIIGAAVVVAAAVAFSSLGTATKTGIDSVAEALGPESGKGKGPKGGPKGPPNSR